MVNGVKGLPEIYEEEEAVLHLLVAVQHCGQDVQKTCSNVVRGRVCLLLIPYDELQGLLYPVADGTACQFIDGREQADWSVVIGVCWIFVPFLE